MDHVNNVVWTPEIDLQVNVSTSPPSSTNSPVPAPTSPSSPSLPSHHLSLPSGPPPLDLTPCTDTDFINLPVNELGRYELVDGLLVSRPMPAGSHDAAVATVLEQYRNRVRQLLRHSSSTPPFAVMGAVVFIRPGLQRLPDLAIGRPLCQDGAPSFPQNVVPDLILEVTSGNRATDLGPKVDEYASIGVKHYVVVDRDVPRRQSSRRRQVVRIHSLTSQGYNWEEYGPDDIFTVPLVGEFTGSDLLNPSSPTKYIKKSIEEEERRLAQAWEVAERERNRADRERNRADRERNRADSASRERDTERRRADTERRRADSESRRAKKYKERMRMAGMTVSSSESDGSYSSQQ